MRLDDLRIPPGNRLEALKGDRVGRHSFRINDQWRVVLRGANARHGTLKLPAATRGNAMTVKREDLDAGRVDFTDVITGRWLPPVHPGEILRDDFLIPMAISVYTLAKTIKAPRSRVNDIVFGRRAITTDTALRLGQYFGITPEFWINLQARRDLE
jgi:addiction module HigA family antidote